MSADGGEGYDFQDAVRYHEPTPTFALYTGEMDPSATSSTLLVEMKGEAKMGMIEGTNLAGESDKVELGQSNGHNKYAEDAPVSQAQSNGPRSGPQGQSNGPRSGPRSVAQAQSNGQNTTQAKSEIAYSYEENAEQPGDDLYHVICDDEHAPPEVGAAGGEARGPSSNAGSAQRPLQEPVEV